jgi:hypothetical protein
MISIDSISPTVQFLNKDQQQDIPGGFNEDLQEATAAEDDIQVIYYEKDVPSKNKDTKSISLNTSNNSCDDKENDEPMQQTPEIKDTKDPSKKLSYSAALKKSPNRVNNSGL